MYMNRRGNPDRYITTDYFRDVVALIEKEKKVELIGVPLMANVDGVFKRFVRLDCMEDIYTKLSPAQRKRVQRKPWIPDVFANAHSERDIAGVVDRVAPSRGKVALFVEDTVVRQPPFVVRIHPAAVGDYRRRVVGVVLRPVHEAHNRHNALR